MTNFTTNTYLVTEPQIWLKSNKIQVTHNLDANLHFLKKKTNGILKVGRKALSKQAIKWAK